MTHWMCTVCGSCIEDGCPPVECPHCGRKCTFSDVTCYRPECGGESNIDPLVVSATYEEVSGRKKYKPTY